jgi:hypothetical protein
LALSNCVELRCASEIFVAYGTCSLGCLSVVLILFSLLLLPSEAADSRKLCWFSLSYWLPDIKGAQFSSQFIFDKIFQKYATFKLSLMSNDEQKNFIHFYILHIKNKWFLLELDMALVTTIGKRFALVWGNLEIKFLLSKT